MTNEVKALRRQLNAEDLERMRIPRRYWDVRPELVSDAAEDGKRSPRWIVEKYIGMMSVLRRRGHGLVLWGPNGTGKTSMAVCLAKEFRRRGVPGLFLEAAEIRSKIFEREMFDEDELLWDRAMDVPVLILDDFGKGRVAEDSNFLVRTVDSLIRHRTAALLVTFVTTNMSPAELKPLLINSTFSSLREHATAVHVRGTDRRIETQREFAAVFQDA